MVSETGDEHLAASEATGRGGERAYTAPADLLAVVAAGRCAPLTIVMPSAGSGNDR